MNALLPKLRAAFNEKGVDICEPFKVSSYNKLVKKFPLNTFSREEPMAVIVGSTKVFWPHFENWIKTFNENQVPKDPMDTFYQHTISQVIENDAFLSKVAHEIRYDWSSPRSGLFAHVQTAGHLAGFAHYDQDVLWSCHPTFGLWFVYRAVVIFDVEWDGPDPMPAPQVFTEETKSDIRKWTAIANEEKWQVRATRLRIRDCCPIGKEQYRYQGECLKFFFPIDEPSDEVIKRIMLSKDTNSTSTAQNLEQTHIDQQKMEPCCHIADVVEK